MIKSRQIAKALFELETNKTPNLSEKFVAFMKRTNMTAQIPAVLYHLEKINEIEKEKNGISIEVAHQAKPETIKEIKKFLNAEHGDETVKINPNLLAGFTAKWQGKFYDMSIASGLKKLEESIIK